MNHNPVQRIIIADNIKKVRNINPYLLDAEYMIISPRPKPLSPVQPMLFGSKPADGGALIIEADHVDPFLENEKVRRFVKRFVGSENFINDFPRFCIWVEENQVEEAMSLPLLYAQFDKCRKFRETSKKAPTREAASRCWQFAEPRHKSSNAIIIPSVSSESRDYIPIGFVDKDTVISNSAFAIYDAEKWLFALLTSKMHNLWVRTVGGRLKTDYRYSATLCYNTFPFPELTTGKKAKLERLRRISSISAMRIST